MVDGQPGATYDHIALLTFSPDSRHVAYAAKQGDKWQVLVDGKPGPAYDEIYMGTRLVFDSPTRLHTIAMRNHMVYRVDVTIPTTP